MIFVTVGTYKGDELINAMDDLAPSLDSEVIAQIGQGKYEPRNCKFFRFAPSLDDYYDKAHIVIGMGGVGTIFDLLNRKTRFIGVSNPALPDKHQNDLLEKLANEKYIYWCKDLAQLRESINNALSFEFKTYSHPHCEMDQVILDFLRSC